MKWAAWTLIVLAIAGAAAYSYRDFNLLPILSFAGFLLLLVGSAVFDKEEHCMCPTCQPMATAATALLFISIITGVPVLLMWVWGAIT